MPQRFQLLLGLALPIGLVAGANRCAAGPDVDFSTVKAEVATALARHQSHAEHIQQDREVEQFDELKQHRVISKIRYRTRRNGPACLFEAVVDAPPPADIKIGLKPRANSQVLAGNSRYRFELQCPGGPPAWRLKVLHMTDAADPVPKSLTPDSLIRDARAARPFETAKGALLTYLFDAPSFKLVSCGPSPADAALVRITFTDTQPEVSKKPASRTTGWYDLDPAAGWSVRECDETFTYGDSTTAARARLTSDLDAQSGVVLLREVRSEVRLTRGTSTVSHMTSKAKYNMRVEPDLAEREFTLSAYGLPEPVGIMWEKPTPRYVWFLLAGGAFASLAVGFRYLARRRTPPTPA